MLSSPQDIRCENEKHDTGLALLPKAGHDCVQVVIQCVLVWIRLAWGILRAVAPTVLENCGLDFVDANVWSRVQASRRPMNLYNQTSSTQAVFGFKLDAIANDRKVNSYRNSDYVRTASEAVFVVRNLAASACCYSYQHPHAVVSLRGL